MARPYNLGMKLLFILCFLIAQAFAQDVLNSYIPPTKILRAKGYQIGVYGDSFITSKKIPLALMNCISEYPPLYEDLNLLVILSITKIGITSGNLLYGSNNTLNGENL
jgi:hypothetical protein